MKEVSYALRKEMERAGLPFELTWDAPAAYFTAWLLARKAGKKISVAEACAQAGFSPDALRQRRRSSPEFAAGERWARRGEPYIAQVVEPEPIKAADHGPGKQPLEGDSQRAEYPLPLVIPAAGAKLKPESRRRDGVPAWAGGTGYEHL